MKARATIKDIYDILNDGVYRSMIVKTPMHRYPCGARKVLICSGMDDPIFKDAVKYYKRFDQATTVVAITSISLNNYLKVARYSKKHRLIYVINPFTTKIHSKLLDKQL